MESNDFQKLLNETMKKRYGSDSLDQEIERMLANQIEISVVTLRRWMNGDSAPSPGMQKLVLKLIRTRIIELF